MDLYEEARRRFSASPRPDWKHDTEVAYEHWLSDQSDEAMGDIALAISPAMYYISQRHTYHQYNFTREEAFLCGMERLAYSVRKFDPAMSPRGISEVSSYILWAAENGMRRGVAYARKHADVCSLDSFDLEAMESLSGHNSYDIRTPVCDVVRDVIATLAPSDRLIAECKLFDDMSWSDVLIEAQRAGDMRTTREAIRGRFRDHIRPKFVDALRRAGYEG